jgi:glycolate oxidase FAD binding subunit
MKNVAGYDVSRLMVGALGTLGVLLDVSLKVLPRPQHDVSVAFELDQESAIRRVNEWAARPYPISATCHEDRRLTLRLSGSEPGVEALARELGGERIADGEAFWHAVREQQCGFFREARTLWRLGVKSTTPPLPLPGAQMIEWNGALRWIATDADPAEIRALARSDGGHATWYRGATARAAVFHPPAAGLMRLHERLKRTFDPAGVLNRGRLYPGL